MASCTCDRADCYNCVFERGYQLGLNAYILDTDRSHPMTTNPKPLLTRKQVAAFADMECDCTDPRCKFEESACRTIEQMAKLLEGRCMCHEPRHGYPCQWCKDKYEFLQAYYNATGGEGS